MARYEVFIPATTPDELNLTLRVTADTWMAALKIGLKKIGHGTMPSDVLCDVKDDESIHVTDPRGGRVFRIVEIPEVSDPGLLPLGADPGPANVRVVSREPASMPPPVIAPTAVLAASATPAEAATPAATPTAAPMPTPTAAATPAPTAAAVPTTTAAVAPTPPAAATPAPTAAVVPTPPAAATPTPAAPAASAASAPAAIPTPAATAAPTASAASTPTASATAAPTASAASTPTASATAAPTASAAPEAKPPPPVPEPKPAAPRPQAAESKPPPPPPPDPKPRAEQKPPPSPAKPKPPEKGKQPDKNKPSPVKVVEVAAPRSTPPRKIGRPAEVAGVEEILIELFDKTPAIFHKDRDAALYFLLDLAMEKIPSDSGTIYLADLNRRDLGFAVARGPKARELLDLKLRVPMGRGFVGFCAQEGVAVAISDAQRDPRFFKEVSARLGYETKSVLTTPILAGGRTLGAVQLLNKQGSTSFTHAELSILHYLAHQAALYLEAHDA